MSHAKKVKPVQPGGFADFGPALAAARARMIDAIRGAYELYGFQPLDTPCVEFLEVLVGDAGDTEKEIFRLVNPEEDKELALRFDLTVPLSRYVAANTDLLLPFKRYQIGHVFRGEKPQAGRFRQFVQVDADIVGAKTGLADAEIVAAAAAALRALGIERFAIKLFNRKIHDGLAEALGIGDRGAMSRGELVNELLRVLDKLDKIGREAVRAELMRRPTGEHDRALALTAEQVALVDRFLDIGGDNEAKLDQTAALIRGDLGAEGVAELREVLGYLRGLGCADCVRIDTSLARGLAYYTSTVVEAILADSPEFGSIAGGGRYDEMVGRFHANPIPAVGVSIGLDRLFDALQRLDLVKASESEVDALIVVFDPKLMPAYLEHLRRLREAGLAAEIYLGSDSGFKAQMRYGLRKGAKFLVICGEDEIAKNGVQVKNLAKREQEFVAAEALIDYVTRKKSELA